MRRISTNDSVPVGKKRCGRPRLPENTTYFNGAIPSATWDALSDEAEKKGITIRDLYREILGSWAEQKHSKASEEKPVTQTINQRKGECK